MEWMEFLAALEAGVDVLEDRVGAAESGAGAPVCYDPHRLQPSSRECLIGVGSAGAHSTQPSDAIVLNDKAQPPGDGVTELALSASSALRAAWREAATACEPAAFFTRFQLVVEDASPDSGFGLVALLAVLNEVPVAAVPAQWRRYVAAWEHGESRSADPLRAWGPLHNALVHGLWDVATLRDGGHQAGLALSQAWLHALRLLSALLGANSAPEPIQPPLPCPQLARAQAFFQYEVQVYRQTLAQAERLQLLLPLRGSAGRYRLLDACVVEEMSLGGVQKILLRNDRDAALLGDGFGLIALHRQGLPGSGDDMSISVDPSTGVHLRALWQELEQLEDRAWGDQRPCDDPRRISAYPRGRRADGSPSPNQPWWDDRGSYTLLAAPRRVRDNLPGTRLDWRRDVLEALWRHGRPDRHLRVTTPGGGVRSLLDCAPEPRADTGKGVLMLRWPTPAQCAEAGSSGAPMLLTPTLKRCLAARLTAAAAGGDALAELPPEESFDFVTLPGGCALTHAAGVVVLDDWRAVPLCEQEIETEINQTLQRVGLLDTIGRDALALLRDLRELVRRRRWLRIEDVRVLDQLAELRIQLCQGMAETLSTNDDPRIGEFRQALERRWGTAKRLEAIEYHLEQTEQTLRSHLADWQRRDSGHRAVAAQEAGATILTARVWTYHFAPNSAEGPA
jgi:hypothetical protein